METLKPTLAHCAEFAAAYCGLKIFRLLGPETASNLGGKIVRWIGPFISASKTAYRNLELAMPELTKAERQKIVAESWENLGRTIGELAHSGSFQETKSGPGFYVTGAEYLADVVALDGPCLFFTGHLGNWEMILPAFYAHGVDLAFMYRAANNPLIDALIDKMRRADSNHKVTMFAKGASGARSAYAHLLRKGDLGMLVDQKLDNGIAVPFFKIPAMTAPAIATFALKFRCPLLPIHVERDGPARLNIICEKPLILPDTGDKEADILAVMTEVNEILEGWIRRKPGSWLWQHRRWPKNAQAAV